jgi:hypothetical protein
MVIVKINFRENQRGRQSRMDNPETQAAIPRMKTYKKPRKPTQNGKLKR